MSGMANIGESLQRRHEKKLKKLKVLTGFDQKVRSQEQRLITPLSQMQCCRRRGGA